MSEALRTYKVGNIGGIELLADDITSTDEYAAFEKGTAHKNGDIYSEIDEVEKMVEEDKDISPEELYQKLRTNYATLEDGGRE